eukprot:GHVH01013946.1.p1 GENE.GHVH01013946.1~~GHVH01013946.1.p1  ORF type:complete len:505 (+),score=69.68 GHVH01013946.1:181-1695(+)
MIPCDVVPPLGARYAASESTTDTNFQRLSVLKNRWVAVLTAGFEMTKVCQYEALAQLGVKIFLVEEEDNPVARRLEELEIAVHVKVSCSGATPDLVHRVVCALDRETMKVWNAGERPNQDGMEAPGRLAAAFTLWDDAVCLASRVQQALGLRGDAPEVIDTCHDKFLARLKLESKGIAGPRAALIRNQEDVESVAKNLRYPIVLKPVNGAASIGVHFMNSHEELVKRFAACQDGLKQTYDDSELMGLVFADGAGVASAEELLNFCAEEMLDGPEFDVDVLLIDGVAVYSNIGQDWSYRGGWMCERGMHHPASLSSETYSSLQDAAARCAIALGCTTGVFHVEMMIDKRLGPQMIECNPRMGGGPVYEFHKLVWDVDLIAEVVMAAVGVPGKPCPTEQPQGLALSLLCFCDTSGVLRDDIAARNQHIIDDPRTSSFNIPGKAGDEIRGWLDKRYPTHLGRVDFFLPKGDPKFTRGLEWAFSRRAEICVPLDTGDEYDSYPEKLTL